MTKDNTQDVPASPEAQSPDVREELDQDLITHQGDWRKPPTGPLPATRDQHLGALDDENVSITPPMSGPADLVGGQDQDAQGNETGTTEVGEETLDPRDLLTPGD